MQPERAAQLRYIQLRKVTSRQQGTLLRGAEQSKAALAFLGSGSKPLCRHGVVRELPHLCKRIMRLQPLCVLHLPHKVQCVPDSHREYRHLSSMRVPELLQLLLQLADLQLTETHFLEMPEAIARMNSH